MNTSVPAQAPTDPFPINVALTRALFAHAAMKSAEATLAEEKKKSDEANAELERLMQESGLTNVGGSLGYATFTPKRVYNPTDWRLIHDYVKINDAFDILYRRVSITALRDRENNGVIVPGIEAKMIHQLKLTIA